MTFERKQIYQLLRNENSANLTDQNRPRQNAQYSFNCNALDIIHTSSSLAYNVFHYPSILLPIFCEVVVEAQKKLDDSPSLNSVKKNITVRIFSLPPIYQFCRGTIGQIRSLSDADALLQISGTVVRTSSVRLLEKIKTYQCMNPKCLHRFKIYADPEMGNTLAVPKSCPSKHVSGKSDNKLSSSTSIGGSSNGDVVKTKKQACTSNNFREIESERVCIVIR